MNVGAQPVSAMSAAPIVVGFDGSPAAVAAVRWAASEASRRNLRLQVVHAYLPPSLLGAMAIAGAAQSVELLRADAAAVLAEGVAEAERKAPGVLVSGQVQGGAASRVLRDKADKAAMLVVGVGRAHLIPGGVLGTVTARLAGTVPCPFIAVPRPVPAATPPADVPEGVPEPDAMRTDCRRPVLVGLDGSTASDQALAFAFDMADNRKVPLLAVRVWDDMAGEAAGLGQLLDRDAVDRRQADELSGQLVGWADKYPDVELIPSIRRGHSVGALVRSGSTAREPGLIVVGSRGRGGFTGMILGSTGQGVIAHARCPVAVVHRPH